MRRGHRPRQRGPQPPGRAGGDGPGLAGGEPARIRHLTFQWNWRWLGDVARGPASGGDARREQPDREQDGHERRRRIPTLQPQRSERSARVRRFQRVREHTHHHDARRASGARVGAAVRADPPQRRQRQRVASRRPHGEPVAYHPARRAAQHSGVAQRLDVVPRLEFAGPHLPSGGHGDLALEPDGVADGGRCGSSGPVRALTGSTTPRRHDAKDREHGSQRGPPCNVASWRRATWLHRFSRLARSAKARRNGTA